MLNKLFRHCVGICLASVAAMVLAGAGGTEGYGQSANISFWTGPDGNSYFALAMKAPTAQLNAPRDILVLFDTSATQAGQFKQAGWDALNALLAGLDAKDRVDLMACDTHTRSFTDGFVPARSPELAEALRQLRLRTPLGATDMGNAIDSALAAFENARNAKILVYIGKGSSRGNILSPEDFAARASKLRQQKVPVLSYAVGPTALLDLNLLGALAAQTGGVVVQHSEKLSAADAGRQLLQAAGVAVYWPTSAKLPAAIAESFPSEVPPLRSDRPSILVGLFKPEPNLAIEVEAEGPQGARKLEFAIASAQEDAKLSYLPQLIELARPTGGVTLPLIDMTVLAQFRDLTRLGQTTLIDEARQAVLANNLDAAARLIREGLRRNPHVKEALRVQGEMNVARTAVPSAQEPSTPTSGPSSDLLL